MRTRLGVVLFLLGSTSALAQMLTDREPPLLHRLSTASPAAKMGSSTTA